MLNLAKMKKLESHVEGMISRGGANMAGWDKCIGGTYLQELHGKPFTQLIQDGVFGDRWIGTEHKDRNGQFDRDVTLVLAEEFGLQEFMAKSLFGPVAIEEKGPIAQLIHSRPELKIRLKTIQRLIAKEESKMAMAA
jgi:hypothetical protein